MVERSVLGRWSRGEYIESVQQHYSDPPTSATDEHLFRSGRATWLTCGYRERRAVPTDLGLLALRVCPVVE